MTPSLPGPPLFIPESRKRKHSVVSSASARSADSSVSEQSELTTSPIPQVDGPPETPVAPRDNVLEIEASSVPDEAIDVTNEPKVNLYFDPDELKKMFREACKRVEAEKERKNNEQPENDDMLENAKNWALAQKKSLI